MRVENKKSGRAGNAGFTLVETVVSVLLLSLGMIGLWGLMTSLVRLNDFGPKLTSATTLAEEKVEDLLTLGYSNMVSGSDAVLDHTRQWVVSSGPIADTKKISVTVRWVDVANRTHREQVDMLVRAQ